MSVKATGTVTPPLVFISYSHKDEKWKDRLRLYLKPAEQSGRISVWDDRRIRAGDAWDVEIDLAITRARVAVLLISPDYLASEWLIVREIPDLLERQQQGSLHIVPIMLRPCNWQEVNWLSNMQIFSNPAKPIATLTKKMQEKLFSELADHIVQIVAEQPITPPAWPEATKAQWLPDTPSADNLVNRAMERIGISEAADVITNIVTEQSGTPPPPTEATDAEVRLSPPVPVPTIDSLADFDLSAETQEILRRARILAACTGEQPSRVTSSCLLFAMAEVGRDQSRFSQFFGAPQFLWKELNKESEQSYSHAFARKFPKRPPSLSSGSGTGSMIDFDSITEQPQLLSPNATSIFRRASAISRETLTKPPIRLSEQTEVEESDVETFRIGQIYPRHLLAALLVFKPETGQIGAMALLAKLVTDVPQLRNELYGKVVDYFPDDHPQAWRAILGLDEEGETLEESTEIVSTPETALTPDGELDLKTSVAGFLTDYWQGDDLLDITPDVNALASLVAARSVEPPLSIGLFGDWGSGKTHFMGQMKKRVELLSRQARDSGRPQDEIGYYQNIVQIEFNAWHYIEGNLWASLVEHIFQNLRMTEDDAAELLKERQEELLKKLLGEELAQQAANAAVDVAEQKVKGKQEEIDAIEGEQKEKIEKLAELQRDDVLATIQLSVDLDSQTRSDIDEALEAAGVSGAGQAARDLQAALAEARSVFGRGSSVLTPMLKAPDRKKRFIMLLVILVSAPISALIIGYLMKRFAPQISDLSAFLTGAATLMTTGAYWVRKQVAWVSGWSQKIEAVKQKVDTQIDEQKARERAGYAEQIASHQQELRVLQTKLNASLRERDAAQRRVDEIKAEIKESSTVERLGKFIQDRAASDDYRKHLGVLALIRRDFEKLASLFREQREAERTGNWAQDDKTINRIILYIDDLDRCPPERVVQVLQAIHLLLAFKLFVVIVGVDARWVTRSLKESYEWLRIVEEEEEAENEKPATGKIQGATPHDYLEKIFQIPFWLNPMGDEACKKLLDGLTKDSRRSVEAKKDVDATRKAVDDRKSDDKKSDDVKIEDIAQPQPQVAGPSADTGAVTEPQPHGGEARPQDTQLENVTPESVVSKTLVVGTDNATPKRADIENGGARAVGEEKTGEANQEIDLAPQSLKIEDVEVAYMKELTRLIRRSPRAVKRFLNCYRLYKVGLRPEQLKKFIGEDGQSGEYKAVMILLGVITGTPALAPYFIEELEKSTPKARSLHEFLDLLHSNPEVSQQPDWMRVKELLKDHVKREDSAATLKALVAVVPRVSRYSFRVARVEAARQKKQLARPKEPAASLEKSQMKA